MTNLELIKLLKEYPGNMPVMVSEDPEGNNFKPFRNISAHYFNSHNEIVILDDTDDKSKLTLRLVLWP